MAASRPPKPKPPAVVALEREVDARVAAIKAGMAVGVEKIVAQYEGNQSAAARATGALQQMLSSIKVGRWGGLDGLVTIAAVLGIKLDQVADLRNDSVVVPIAREVQFVLGEAPGWAAAVEEARVRYDPPEWTIRAAGGLAMPAVPVEITPELVRDVARLLLDHCEGTKVVRVRRQKQE